MLDAHAAAVERRCRTRRCRRRRTRPAPSSRSRASHSTPPRSRRARGPRRSGEHHVGHHAGADHDARRRRARSPLSRHDVRDAARRRPRSARARPRRGPRCRAPPGGPGSSARRSRRSRARACTASCITIAHVVPRSRQRRGDLAADVGAADQHDALRAVGVLADRVGVAERAQVVDPLELAALDVQPPHVRAGREQRLVEARPPPWSTASPRAPPCRASVTLVRVQQLDPLLAPTTRSGGRACPRATRALQVALRARRAVVGRVGLAPDEQDRALGAGLAQPARAVGARRGRRRSAGSRPCAIGL